ncbi:MAG TPA: sigma 54-interacting transcriptional regulator, partial [Blastocatellia bacterium]|nr:sigma 54-interacting transcriptional regulator [Blastocatellia bacterium]
EVLQRVGGRNGAGYDVVLLDYNLSGLDALEVLKELRFANKLDVPVVIVTGTGDEEVALQAIKLGASSYVVKNPGYLHQLPTELESANLRAESIRRERELRLGEERYKLATAAGNVGVWDWELESGETYIDPILKRNLGYEDHEIRNHFDDWSKLFYPEDAGLLEERARAYIAGEIPNFDLLYRVVHKDGGTRWILARCNVVRDADGKAVRLVGTKMDITDRKRADDALRESEERLRLALQAGQMGAWDWERSTNRLKWSREHFTIMGLAPFSLEPTYQTWAERVHPDDHARAMSAIQKAIREHTEYWSEYRVVWPDGTVRWVESRGLPLYDAAGECTTVRGLIVDVTDRKRAEEALRESEERYRSVVDSQTELICRYLPDTTLTFVNEAYCRYFGKTRDQLIGTRFLDLIPEFARDVARRHVESLIEKPRVEVDEHEVLLPDGSIGWQRWVDYGIHDGEGKLVEFQAAGLDITERKKAESIVLQRDQLLHAMFNSLSSQVVVLDRSGVITYSSKSWDDFAGANHAVIGNVGVGVNYLDACRSATGSGAGDQFAGKALEGIQKVMSGAASTFTMEYPCHSSEEERWFLMCVDAMQSEQGGVVVSYTDITQRKQTEGSLEHTLLELQQLKDRLHAENIYLQEAMMVAHDFGEIIGRSKALRKAERQAQQVAPLDTTVLITGETGTGKELLAHAIHNLSPRGSRTLVKVNCATLPAQLIESELFGHEKGAFTGALAKRVGRFEVANGGTIFLDEIGELPLDLQTKLLRVLQEGEFEHVGSSHTTKVDVRVIAATNRDLEEAVQNGTFRSDLYYRLSIFPIRVPALRERREDIPMLVAHFVKQLALKLGKQIESIPHETMEALQNYSWPGNVRELRNVIERAAIITQGTNLRLLDSLESRAITPPPIVQPEPRKNVDFERAETLEESQRKLIVDTLHRTFWRVEGQSGAAALLGLHPNTLRSRMKRLGITKPTFKEPS